MPHRVLVADDELDIRFLVKTILEKNGYEVLLARDGAEALQKARSEVPDLILLDVMMPERSGWEVCRILKSQDNTRHIPIVMFSALSVILDNHDVQQQAKEVGADDYLPKPFNATELINMVRKNESVQKSSRARGDGASANDDGRHVR